MINSEKKKMTEQMRTSARIRRNLASFEFDENELSEITESVIRLADATGAKLDKAISMTLTVFKGAAKSAFIAGVEFARRWISVDEELPEAEEYVFIKWRGGYIFRAKLIEVNAEDDVAMRWVDQRDGLADIESPVTHWRHIELK
ncbi:MAG: DUF551 domain-containing protein [Prevotellaceae bacterium]|jgi:hypothetical protein|nr:DUF551 domain-containing protein [Prevotellaceae bacterium]